MLSPSCGLVKMLPILGLCLIAWAVGEIHGARDGVFTNSFVVEMHDGAGEAAHSIAKRHDFEYRGTVSDYVLAKLKPCVIDFLRGLQTSLTLTSIHLF